MSTELSLLLQHDEADSVVLPTLPMDSILTCDSARYKQSIYFVSLTEEMSEAASEDLLDCLEEICDGVLQESVAVAADVTMQGGLFCGSVGKEDFKSMLRKSVFGMPLCVSTETIICFYSFSWWNILSSAHLPFTTCGERSKADQHGSAEEPISQNSRGIIAISE
jgi:hypothetical protein